VKNWKREPLPSPKGTYLYGAEAYRKWIDDIGTAGDLNDKDRANLFFVSWWNFNCLSDARTAAIRFLRDASEVLGGEAGDAVDRAIALYEKEGILFGEVFRKRDAFFGPWAQKAIEDWTEAAREREREVLGQALELEGAAIGHIEEVLKSIAK
jgi:hypothetical protein